MSGYGGRVQPEEWPEDDGEDWSAARADMVFNLYREADRQDREAGRPRHGRDCRPSDPEIGCECGYAEWAGEKRATDEAEAERIAEMFGAQIAIAWRTIETCAFKDQADGTCSHPTNPTPECHGAICPLVPHG